MVGPEIFAALLDQFERAKRQAQLAHFFFIRALRALTVATQPRPEKWRGFGIPGR
jgi:hypothetical protein